MSMNLYDIQQKVENQLTKKRFYHTLGVQTICFSLALVYGSDSLKAIYAGLLHDLAKCIPDEELLSECKKYQLPISQIEEKNPYLLHGKLGAYYAKKNFKINDEEILNAITYHTTGRPDMSLLEKIVFVADFIEPNRSEIQISSLKTIRKLAFKDLDDAVFLILKNTLSYLKNMENQIDTLTIDAYNYYKR